MNDAKKAAFGQAFAEVVVESSLRVVGKGNGRLGRQGKKLELPSAAAESSTSTSTSTTEKA
ncbi:Protein of unknown function [Gryllus bimaculatus]|nr:Protein of unknown function [Gryllus bimaculatus]